MDLKRDVLMAKVNFYVSVAFIFSCGLFFLIVGFRLTHLPNPIARAMNPAAFDESQGD